MTGNRALPMAMACALSIVLACGKSRPGTATAPGRPQSAVARANTGNACDRKLLTAADAATILSDPITGTRSTPGDPQSCEFTTTSFSSVRVTLRPGLGRTSLGVWKSGRMPISGTSLSAVGDEAVWVSSLSEVIAEKDDLLCDIQVTDLAAVLGKGPAAAQQKAIGRLCNKIFMEAR